MIRSALSTVATDWWAHLQPTAKEHPIVGLVLDGVRSRRELLAENALLRQQLITLRRQVKRPKIGPRDRLRLVVLAAVTRTWREALLLVQPDTVLRWHRAGFRALWCWKSRTARRFPRTSLDTVALIQRMARENRLWGAERIRGELLKLAIRVSKRTIQKYMRGMRPSRQSGQTWARFLRNHANETWACDFLQTYDALFRAIFVFVIVEHGSRRVVHLGVTRSPTSAWVTQQLREVTAWGAGPRFLIRDNDDKFGPRFDDVATGTAIKILRTPHRAPRANAICERFLGSLRRECLDHGLILGADHLRRVTSEYQTYFNHARPHQGISQRRPTGANHPRTRQLSVAAVPVLGGLHHDYRLAA